MYWSLNLDNLYNSLNSLKHNAYLISRPTRGVVSKRLTWIATIGDYIYFKLKFYVFVKRYGRKKDIILRQRRKILSTIGCLLQHCVNKVKCFCYIIYFLIMINFGAYIVYVYYNYKIIVVHLLGFKVKYFLIVLFPTIYLNKAVKIMAIID